MSSGGATDPIGALLLGTEADFVCVDLAGAPAPDGHIEEVALFPGSFNPLHHGHEALAAVASELLGREVVFELSVVNVDKPPLTHVEVERRVSQFAGRWRVLLTRAPRFVEKARLFPGRAFVIGWDTAVRLVHPRYYGDSARAMHDALEEMRDLGARFLVAGRTTDGTFLTLEDADLPEAFADLFEGIPESLFRADVSSTDLRG